MPSITISLSDTEFASLQNAYEAERTAAPAMVPPFEQWLASRVAARPGPADAPDHLPAIDAIEKLITGLQAHGLALVYLARRDASPAGTASALANSLAAGLNLPQHQAQRLQQLFEYYLKSAREAADLAQVGMTARTHAALHEAYADLFERITRPGSTLEENRAIGRAEGAVAVLVSLNAISREAAKEKISALRLQLRGGNKAGWVGKVFGSTADDE